MQPFLLLFLRVQAGGVTDYRPVTLDSVSWKLPQESSGKLVGVFDLPTGLMASWVNVTRANIAPSRNRLIGDSSSLHVETALGLRHSVQGTKLGFVRAPL